MTDDYTLLRRFFDGRSEPAFAELVARHIDLVYSAALRVVNGDTYLAEDVAQTVFIALARKAGSFPKDFVLAGWLYRQACHAAASAVRTEQRRRKREQLAMEITSINADAEPAWAQIAPHLDACLSDLSASDRDALVLRFLKRQDLLAVGAALGVSEDAAQKRVSRALEKLRRALGRRGVALSCVGLTSVLAAAAVIAAPQGLVAGVTLASLAAPAESSLITLVKYMASTKVKSAVMAVIVGASIGAPFVIEHQAQAALRSRNEALAGTSERIAMLRAENERLSEFMARGQSSRRPDDEQFRDVLRLRGEVGRLETAVQQLASSETRKPISREDALASMKAMYADRIARLKQLFAANPKESVPELRYLTDDQWLKVVQYDHHLIDPDNSGILSSARGSAQFYFGNILSEAAWQYVKDNGGQFPTDLTQLTPYFKSPVDDAVLHDWAILPGNSLPGTLKSDTPWVITEASAVNPAFDQRMVIGPNFVHLGSGQDPSQWGSPP